MFITFVNDGSVYFGVLYAVLYSSRQMNATITSSTSCVLPLILQNLSTFILVWKSLEYVHYNQTSTVQQQPIYSHYTGQPVLSGTLS